MAFDDETLENVGLGLQYRRKKEGLTMQEAATRAGITRQDVSRIEHGAPGVSWAKVMPYLVSMGITLPQMIPTRDHYQSEPPRNVADIAEDRSYSKTGR